MSGQRKGRPGDEDGPNTSADESSHDSPQPRRGATPRWINLYPKPAELDIVKILSAMNEPTLEDVLAHMTGDAWLRIVIDVLMKRADTPADLEVYYNEFRRGFAGWPEYLGIVKRNYHDMWAWFTGGHG